MKSLLAVIIVSSFTVAARSQTNTNAAPSLTWRFQAPVNGIYGPATGGWFAWENIEIESNRFHYFVCSDSLGDSHPNYKGKIIQFCDHICLDHPKMPDPDRVSGLLTNRPVLWTYDAFDHWKKTGEINPMGILYLRAPFTPRDPATNRNEMFRQVRAAVRDNR